MLKICILSNEKPEKTLESLDSIKAEILIEKPGKNRAETKNYIVSKSKNKFFLFIEPNEILLSGHEILSNPPPGVFRVQCITGKTCNKEIRLFSKEVKWENPVYETINHKSEYLPVTLYAKKKNTIDYDVMYQWFEDNPGNPSVLYYMACTYLSQKKYDDFVVGAEKYLFYKKNNISSVMMRYYLAYVQSYVFKDYKKSTRNIIQCLASNTLMAEFWCLLGDIYMSVGKMDKSWYLYNNAINLGSKRKVDDEYPVEFNKYKSYPNSIMDFIKNEGQARLRLQSPDPQNET